METAEKWINEYSSCLINKDFDHYATLFTRDVEYYDEPFEHSIGDKDQPNDEHFMLCDSMRNFLGSHDVSLSNMEIICTSGNTAVYRFILRLDKDNEETLIEFVVIAKFRDDLCEYYYQTWYLKTW